MGALDRLQRYPDGFSTDLREALAAVYDRSPEQITIGCGTCELLYLLAHAVLERGDEVVLAAPSFTSYRDVIDIRGAVPVTVPAGGPHARSRGHGRRRHAAHQDDLRLQPEQPDGDLRAVGRGRAARRARARRRHGRHRRGLHRVRHGRGPRGLAGDPEGRTTTSSSCAPSPRSTGSAACAPATASAPPRSSRRVDKVRQPFNVNLLGQLAAIEALKHPDQVAERRETNARLRDLHGRAARGARPRHRPHRRPTSCSSTSNGLVRPARQGVRHAALHGRDRARRQRARVPGLGAGDRGYRGGDRVLPGQAGLARGRPRGARRREAGREHDGDHARGGDRRRGRARLRARRGGRRQRAHLSAASDVTVIGVIGDREAITELPLEAMPGVDRVVAILRPYKLVSREFQQRDTVIDVKRRQDRRRALRAHRRPVLHRDAGAGAGGRPGRQGGGRPHDARRRLQAAHLALRLPGSRRGRPGDDGRRAGRDRPADRHRGHGPARPGRRLPLRRRAPGRRAQHAELPAARGAGQGRQAGAAQARARRRRSRSCSCRPSTSSRRATAT